VTFIVPLLLGFPRRRSRIVPGIPNRAQREAGWNRTKSVRQPAIVGARRGAVAVRSVRLSREVHLGTLTGATPRRAASRRAAPYTAPASNARASAQASERAIHLLAPAGSRDSSRRPRFPRSLLLLSSSLCLPRPETAKSRGLQDRIRFIRLVISCMSACGESSMIVSE